MLLYFHILNAVGFYCICLLFKIGMFAFVTWFCVCSFFNTESFSEAAYFEQLSVFFIWTRHSFFTYYIFFHAAFTYLLTYLQPANFSHCVFHVAYTINSVWQNLLILTWNIFAIIFRFLCEYNAKECVVYLLQNCKDLLAYFSRRLLISLQKATRMSLDRIKRRMSVPM